ncbi:MAG: ATP-grasp domain-containing protein, partial [Thaumarchaeota archaeon]|nr:ATP-grasp domain-containing protein [Nitrososphaerota archaeon]
FSCNTKFRKTAEEAALKLGSKGPINIQGRFHEDKLKIFEINPRFSASTPMRAVAGVNEADIVFRNLVLHEKIKVESYRHLVCLRYWNEVYVPLATYTKAVDQKIINDPDSFIPAYF